ncbi:ABC transporter ATP-binding protein [Streptococcus penaeicida]|uniref:ABC transporter ATP-binding protein n=1 Tax=Streptococcus penaeicida TaxID=1765960 RepID=A0A2N8LC75_9STRE|nr:ABC transporter ATP-binding protein [Streptococcus penaeicida]PND47773.1 ABC transporter ATP-binding protein [Streptococcus penaeicida]
MLEIHNLTYGFSEKASLFENLCLIIEVGQRVLISGYSGCGKSTLAYLLAGLKKAQQGSITLDGEEIKSESVGLIFQNPDLQFCMDTVEHELFFVLENQRTPKNQMTNRVKLVLEQVGLPNTQKRKLDSLSQGEKQRLSLACLFLREPKVIILDEAFANLDSSSAKALFKLVLAYQAQHRAILICIDHLFAYYQDQMDTYYWFENGLTAVSYQHLQNAMPALSIGKKALPLGKKLLETKGLKVRIDKGHHQEYPDISLSENEIICLNGPSGSGKSSFFLGILGLYPKKADVFQMVKKQELAFLFQNPLEQFIYAKVYDEIFQSCRNQSKTKAILEKLDLWDKKDLSPFQLSQGQQRRLAVGIILASQAKLILLDEPTYGQDAYHAQLIINLILDYFNQHQCGLIFTSHDDHLKTLLADRFVEVEHA